MKNYAMSMTSMTLMSMTRPLAVADCAVEGGHWVLLAPTAAPAKGTGLSAYRIGRDRFGNAPTPTAASALLPNIDVVTGVVNAGIRTWSPPV